MMPFTLANKVVLITGSTQGLGRVLALELAALGATVCVHGRSERAAGAAVVQEIADRGGNAVYFPFDVTDLQATTIAVDTIERTVGPLAALITCASRYDVAKLDALAKQQWQEVIDTTLTGTYHLCHTVIPRLQERKWGRVITMGCVGCDRVYPGTRSVAYRVAASGVLSLTRAYAQLSFRDGVTVNCIAPGFLENTTGPVDAAQLPAGRLTQLTEILPTVRFLLSDDAAHVSGACLNVAGGYCA